jgi:hypothetical protein
MNFFWGCVFLSFILSGCGVKVPYTNQIKNDFNLDSEREIKKVQFYISSTIILQKSKSSGNQGTADNGALVASSSKEQDRIIIPVNAKCVFDQYGSNDELFVRFEIGVGKTLSFSVRPGQSNSKYYLIADWNQEKGGKITYGNDVYYATPSSGSAYLQVVLKKLQKTKRKDRIVKGMKV